MSVQSNVTRHASWSHMTEQFLQMCCKPGICHQLDSS